MIEHDVEERLRTRLHKYGFKCLKLVTPGTSGTKDRLILMPAWAPSPPAFVELKRPDKAERALQSAVRDDWRGRGCNVLDMCDTYEKVDALVDDLLTKAVIRYCAGGNYGDLPEHIRNAYVFAAERITAKRKA